MSDLLRICNEVSAVAGDITAVVQRLQSDSQQIGSLAQQAARMAPGKGAASVVGILEEAARRCGHAAHALAAAQIAAERFVGNHQGGSGAVGNDAHGNGMPTGKTDTEPAGATGTSQPELTDFDQAAITGYSEFNYLGINRALREGIGLSVEGDIAKLDTALAKLPVAPGLVYRGTHLSTDQMQQFREGCIVTDPAFGSTSRDPANAFPGNARFHISTKSGRDVSAWSAHPHEQETLIPRGAKFKVHRVVERRGLMLILLEEL